MPRILHLKAAAAAHKVRGRGFKKLNSIISRTLPERGRNLNFMV